MNCVPMLHLFHGRTNGERSSVPLAHDVYALVVKREGAAAGTLAVQKLLGSVFPYLLHPAQAFLRG